MKKQPYNDNDLLLFLYDEMDAEKSDAFLSSLANDEEMWTKYEYFQEIKEQVETISYEPSDASIQKILKKSQDEWFVSILKPHFSNFKVGAALAVCVIVLAAFSILGNQNNKVEAMNMDVAISEQTFESNTAMNWDDDLGDKMKSLSQQAKNISDKPIF